MPIPAFKNNTAYEIDVPTELGYALILSPGRYVKGTWYNTNGLQQPNGVLDPHFTKVADADTINPQTLIQYTASEVTSAAVGTVTTATLADGTVATVDVANLAITTGLLANGAVTTSKLAAACVAPIATAVTAANSAAAACFPLFVTAATGNLAPKTNAGLAFDASTGELTATTFVGAGAFKAAGTCTLALAATTTVNDAAVGAASRILLFPTNAEAAVVVGCGTANVLTGIHVSAKNAGVSFVLTHDNHADAEGATFDYVILN